MIAATLSCVTDTIIRAAASSIVATIVSSAVSAAVDKIINTSKNRDPQIEVRLGQTDRRYCLYGGNVVEVNLSTDIGDFVIMNKK